MTDAPKVPLSQLKLCTCKRYFEGKAYIVTFILYMDVKKANTCFNGL